MTELWDGTVTQAGMESSFLRGRVAEFSVGGLRLGVVLEVIYKDDDRSKSKTYTEYRVRDLETSQIYEMVRRLHLTGAQENGTEEVLHPMTKLLPGVSGSFSLEARAVDTDGTVVLLGFIEGNSTHAVILGVLEHSAVTYGATKANGERRYTTLAGTSMTFRKDGSYQIRRGENTLTLNADGSVEILQSNGNVFHMLQNGEVAIEARDALMTGSYRSLIESDHSSSLISAGQTVVGGYECLFTYVEGDKVYITGRTDVIIEATSTASVFSKGQAIFGGPECIAARLGGMNCVSASIEGQRVSLGDLGVDEPVPLGNKLIDAANALIDTIKTVQVDIATGLVTPISQAALDGAKVAFEASLSAVVFCR